MTDEEKRVEEIKHDHKECKCGKILTKFLLNTISVFLGVLLALLVLRGLTRPNFPPCHRGMGPGAPRMERQLPPPPMMNHQDFQGGKMHKGQHPQFEKRGDFNGAPQRPNFDKQPPQKTQK